MARETFAADWEQSARELAAIFPDHGTNPTALLTSADAAKEPPVLDTLKRFLPYLWPAGHRGHKVRIIGAGLIVLASKGGISMGVPYDSSPEYLVAAIDANDYPTVDGRPRLNLGIMYTAVANAMYATSLWPDLDAALTYAAEIPVARIGTATRP